MGQYTIQMAKNAGVTVAVRCNTQAQMSAGTLKADYLKSLGTNVIVNYKEADWARVLAGVEFDQILNAVGSEDDWAKAPGVLKADGDYVTIANFMTHPSPEDKVSFKIFIGRAYGSDLGVLVDLGEKGLLKVPINNVYNFKDAPAAFAKSFESSKGSGAMGKLLVKILL